MWTLIDRALAAVPATRWALGIAGAIAAFSLVVGEFQGVAGTFVAGLAIIALMILMVLFAALAGLGPGALRPMGIALAWSFLVLFVGVSFATATSLFKDWPKPFERLTNDLRSALGSAEARAENDEADEAEAKRAAAEQEAARSRVTVERQLGEAEKEIDEAPPQPAANLPPRKVVVPIDDGLYKTVSYWAGGSRSRTTWCQAEVLPVVGMTVIGGDNTASYDTRQLLRRRAPNPRGCAPAGHCDSHNEFCVTYYRASGCYVSTDWLNWYREHQRQMSLAERREEICAR
jgi:hypothetical protein